MPSFFSRSRGNIQRMALRSLGSGLVVSVMGCSATSTLNGAGASFPAPVYQRWFQELAGKGVRVNYQSVGSGAGVRQLQSHTVDFAASDVPMKEEEIAKVPQGVVQIPMTAGSIAVAYQHKDCALKLSQSQLVAIFQGKISNYSQLGCSAKPIKVVVRSDGSGTTANFTAHLAAIDPTWKRQVGSGKSVKWPVGTGAKGNEGVAAQLNQVDGALGYVETAFVKPPLQAAALTNAAGQMVKPTAKSEQEALDSIDLGPNLIGGNPNPPAGYPIVTFSWILLYKTGNGANRETLNKVFSYTLSEPAQSIAESMGYIRLPVTAMEKSKAALESIKP